MPDHFHVMTCSTLKVSETLRYINGITGHRIISFLREGGYDSSLRKIERESGARQHKYSLWDHHPNAKRLTNESSFMQRLNYTHENPVRLGLVERGEDYRWSSARQWKKIPATEESLLVDIKEIQWRRR
jgi:putative transposase